jgi:hypothetical protein
VRAGSAAATGACATAPSRSQPDSSNSRIRVANQAAWARPSSPYRSSSRWLYAIVELSPATATRSSGTANSVQGWSESKPMPSMPW